MRLRDLVTRLHTMFLREPSSVPPMDMTDTQTSPQDKDAKELELEHRAHELAQITHVLEWQARGMVPPDRRKRARGSP
jgi:hypothetical protein